MSGLATDPTREALVIDVSNVSMAYRLYPKPTDLLKEALFGGVHHDTFWALRKVSLRVEEGERVGIVGPNGAGKTTLLQVIAGNLTPTSGSVRVNGKISSFLSLTPAWNAEESGLENIRFNLFVQGVDKRDIPMLTEEIVEFTDLGPFIYQPVKTYSSGMGARLAFAIATAISPEILIIDEVLGAGDAYFAGKAARRMQDLCNRGKALLFVSHSTAAVRQMCDRCVWIENGVIRMEGPTETVVRQYEEDTIRRDEETLREGNKRRLEARINLVAPEDIVENDLWRFRVRPTKEPRVTGTHYVKNISVEISGTKLPMPLEQTDIRHDEVPTALDLLSCEWGRLYHRGADVCRILNPRTGVRKGGHLLVKRVAGNSDELPVHITFDVRSKDREQLTIDFLDLDKGEWRLLEVLERKPIPGGWTRVVTCGLVSVGHEGVTTRAREAAELNFRKPVEILDVSVLVGGRKVMSVDEMQPFTIRATLQHHEALPGVSVNLNVVRSDGAYVFYQPSGLTQNIEPFVGRSVVEFQFDPNPFGAGHYEVNLFATNEFSWDNCPPSDIYDRSIGICLFQVNLRRPVSFGLINVLVPVKVNLDPSADTQAVPPDEGRDRITAVSKNVGRPIGEVINAPYAPLAFPPPYCRMVAINSDVECTSWAAQLGLLRMFADAGLETAFSYWFFADPQATWRLFENDGSPSPHWPAAKILLRSGLLDTLHSFGGVMTGRGTMFHRRHIQLGYARLAEEGIRTEVYSNHGGLLDVQNVGGPWTQPKQEPVDCNNYHEGDLQSSASYHLDLTLAHGMRFFWLDIDRARELGSFRAATHENGNTLFVSQISRDGSPILRFRRTDLGFDPLPHRIGEQITAILENTANGYSVIYNHLGFLRRPDGTPGPNPPPYLSDEGFEALHRLADAQRRGDVLVTTTRRLLGHAFMQSARPWTIERRSQEIVVTFSPSASWGDVTLPMRWEDYDGFAMPIEADQRVELVLGSERRMADTWKVGDCTYAGFQWHLLPVREILEEVSRRAPL